MSSNIHLTNLQIMVEVLFASHMLARFLEHKESYLARLILSSAVCALVAFAFPLPTEITRGIVPWGILMYGCLFFTATAGIWACYQESVIGLLCCGIAGYTIHQTASVTQDLIGSILKLAEIQLPSALLWAVSIIPIYLVSLHRISADLKKNHRLQIDNPNLAMLTVMALLADILSGLVVLELSLRYQVLPYEILVHALHLLICLFILILQKELLSNRRLQTELEIVSNMLEEEKRQYEQSRNNIELINQKCHDLRHQLRAVRRQEGDLDRSVLKEIEQAVNIYDTSSRTGCTALDIILSEKKLLCESQGIMLTCIANASGLSALPSADIYALFGNILDNAMEAVSHLPNDQGKSISLSVRSHGIITVIRQENRYTGVISLKDGLPETIKEDKRYHGYGMRSILMIAQKYNGSLSISSEDGIFSLTVMLSPEELS